MDTHGRGLPPEAEGDATAAQGRVPRYVWTTILPARLVVNAQFRIPYPYLPAISRGLGLPLEAAGLLLTVRALLGVSSPVFGYLADRSGRKAVMILGLFFLIAGVGLLLLGNYFGVAILAFGLLGLAKAAYDPAMQAFISDDVPFEARGRALGLVELSWSGSWLLAVPLAGFLIARWNWRSPFLVIGMLGFFALLATLRLASGGNRVPVAQPGDLRTGVFSDHWRSITEGATLATLAVSALVILASENFLIVYGAWLESRFGLTVTTLGLVSIVMSIAELAGALASAAGIDRIGKRRALLGGLLLNAGAFLLLPLITRGIVGALAGIALVAFTSEFSIVATLPLVSELAPAARGTVLAINTALTSIAAALASVIAPRLWAAGGLGLVDAVSVGAAATAALLLWRGAAEPSRSGRPARGRHNLWLCL